MRKQEHGWQIKRKIETKEKQTKRIRVRNNQLIQVGLLRKFTLFQGHKQSHEQRTMDQKDIAIVETN